VLYVDVRVTKDARENLDGASSVHRVHDVWPTRRLARASDGQDERRADRSKKGYRGKADRNLPDAGGTPKYHARGR
jgi:hypothetical protein